MTVSSPFPFALDAHPAKAVPALLDADVRQLARIESTLAAQIDELEARLGAELQAPAGSGQGAYERDLEVRRLVRRLRLLRRFGLDLCIGRIDSATSSLYIGRVGLVDSAGERLLVDWRAPAAEPFFGATLADPMGAVARRRYRWVDGRIADFWDEVLDGAAAASGAALDDQSAFIASLGASRSPRMRDVLGTIQADQDAIIRADGRGTLVVDGGPGTGKTVVALHRAAYLQYSDPRLTSGHGGVLVVGPSRVYTDYVGDILPGLGEDGVRTCTLADLVPAARDAEPEADRRVAALKADGRMPGAVDAAILRSERVPVRATPIDTAWGELRVGPAEWAEAFATADPASSHNEAREDIWRALLDILVDQVSAGSRSSRGGEEPWGDAGWGDAGWGGASWGDAGSGGDRWDGSGWGDAGSAAAGQHDHPGDDVRLGFDDEEQFDAYGLNAPDADTEAIRVGLTRDTPLRAVFDTVWPLLDPSGIVRRLWSSPALLRECAPWLGDSEAELLQRDPGSPWTSADLPLLDAAALRAGDPEAAEQRRRAAAEAAADRAVMDDVVQGLIATDDSDLKLMSMLRGQDLRSALDTAAAPELSDAGRFAGPFAHIVVDEAQELTAAEWSMLVRRTPSRSFTVVGDRAQARHGFTETWEERLADVGLEGATVASLTINYRTPAEVMAVAAPVIRAVLPDANVPTSIRESGIPVRFAEPAQRDHVLGEWLRTHDEGTACVIGDPSFVPTARVRSLTPVEAKGLEFDLVVLHDPDDSVDPVESIEAAVDRYVAMTRTTGQLVILGGVGRARG
ncbi:HelD family protein [Leifsonia sp. NPDC058194]|uniref:HelD family protein n=1 Tax=Leifsonia sp. NPDC058194 TaxID=3346374 RepID=UPI0036D9E622